MSRFKAVVFDLGYPSHAPELESIQPAAGELISTAHLPVEQALEIARDADAIMIRRTQFTREIIKSLRRTKVLLRYGVGVDNIDLEAATEAGIIVTHIPVYCQDEVSTHAIALLLGCIREVVATNRKIEQGGWSGTGAGPVYRVAGKTMAIIGLGTLGQAVARKLQTWNLRLIGVDPFVESAVARDLNVTLVPLETALRESEYVSLHVPLLPETTHLMNKRTLALMKPGAILVNTARGPVVDGMALLDSLTQGHLACAALDVFEQEPPALDSPLRRHPRLIVSDHMAWYSEESQIDLQRVAGEEVTRACTGGLPKAIANPEVLVKLDRVNEWTPNHLARWQAKRAEALGTSS